ncbi:MAG: AsmA family protein [Burkholderiaceae bacterium]|nr:AsmA family protein [Burkholderiaceae bacterium]MCD8517327.1 AsmA family protein [Burkholderiaceae bacterium]MCD8537628.1 AsmA family protein [Burkholderiaceae bacterium]MCD8566026.1 AsmA family protein [Burkholderiaceae bacterium]
MLKTLMRVALTVSGILLLLLAVVVLLLQTPVANALVENRLRAWVHPTVQVNGDVRVSILPRLGIDLSEVTVPSRQGTHPALLIDQLQFQVSWLPLFERELAVEYLYVQGLEILIATDTQRSAMSDASQKASVETRSLLDWVRGWLRTNGDWKVSVKQALVEKLAVVGITDQTGEVVLATLEQLELRADVNWPVAAGSSATLGLRYLSVNDTEKFGNTAALLEQLGMANNGEWDVMAMDSEWAVQRANPQENTQALELLAFNANGAWGDISAARGTIDLGTGQISIPMQATLTNSPKFKTRAVEINVRQSKMRFELTGTVDNPGVKWLSELRSNR